MGATTHSQVSGNARTPLKHEEYEQDPILEGRKESHMLQSFAVRLQLAKMRAEEGQALIEYALIVSLISVIAIAALTLTGTSVKNMLNFISDQV
jgi:pilus assembly protein Flp/PilA